jgi:hypothetical protein
MSLRWICLFLLLVSQTVRAADLDGIITISRLSSENFSLRVKSTYPVIDTVDVDQQKLVSVELDGFSDNVDPGFYNIPRKLIYVVIPEDKKLVLDTKSYSEMISVSLEHDVEIAQAKVHNADSFYVHSSLVPVQKKYGGNLAVIEDISYAGSNRLATISIWPVSYDSSSRSLGHVSDFEVKISFVSSQDVTPKAPVSPVSSNAFLMPLVVNDWDLPVGSESRLDLIIAHESYREALGSFIEFKKSQGRLF